MKTAKGTNYLLLALGAFLGLATEGIYAFLLEPAIFKAPIGEWTVGQNIIHWIITCVTWAVIAILLVRTAKQKFGFDLFEKKGAMKPWRWLAVVACAVFMIVVSYISWNGFEFVGLKGLKTVHEFQNNGLLKFIFQYLYYIVETVLFMLIIVFGQKAFEIWFKKENFPYGAIAVALTWGIAHIISRGYFDVVNGITSAVSGFIFGIIYLLVKRDIKKTYFILLFLFII